MLLNPVVVSVVVLAALSLARVNVIVALLIAALVAGLMSGLSVEDTMSTLVGGLGGQGETALSYILLGILSVMVARSGITEKLIRWILPRIQGKRAMTLFGIAGLACFSQNLVPVHIAFIPILIPPLLTVFNRMKIDRRAVATALTFGLKAPYMLIPLGFGLIFQNIIVGEMAAYGMTIELAQIPLAMAIPVATMVVGLVIAILVTYRRPREYRDAAPDLGVAAFGTNGASGSDTGWTRQHIVVLIALAVTLVLQLVFGSLVIAALGGVLIIFIFRGERWRASDELAHGGVTMMGTIAFIMLVASGYASVLTETGSVESLVASATAWIGDSQLLAAVVMMTVGLLVTIGIGSSFGTIPILAAIFVPLCAAVGFTPLATAALVGAAGAIGDAGSPASDSTLGPTSGLNVDGQHHHIWDTCVPTFVHFNIPLFFGGIIAAMVL
ncbi:Na+/H+ antiporter family protein [Citricoccus sp. K5]|uniref:Na+/H+ antiporter family protein n=1 Tax=Citricoccus sp. K5 TaxID=2653135 RepID=UPI0012F07E94|nr:SLC13 family permease [Citricoccus sp. K5]VXB57786.1 putative histidine / basic amino acid transporter [Citricoccus sp. K5]